MVGSQPAFQSGQGFSRAMPAQQNVELSGERRVTQRAAALCDHSLPGHHQTETLADKLHTSAAICKDGHDL